MAERIRILAGRCGRVFPALQAGVAGQFTEGRRVLVLVPEQFTLQCERSLMTYLGVQGSFSLEVLSPRRLRERVRENAGCDGLPLLDNLGRGMALARAVTLCRDDLAYYGRVADTPGLPIKLSALIDDIAHADMDPASLRAAAGQLPGAATRAKMTDLAALWDAYHTVVDGRFADGQAQQAELLRRLPMADLAQAAHIWVYGFDELQSPMCDMLSVMAPLCADMTVTMTMDGDSAPDAHVFLAQRRSAGRLTAAMERAGVACVTEYLPRDPVPGTAPVLAHLERMLFARGRVEPFNGDPSPVTLYAAANPFAEAEHCAWTLRDWHDAGIPWSGMAVALAAKPDTALLQTLAACGIPVTAARERPVGRHGLCRMLISALRSACEGYARQDVLDYARSGFSTLDEAESSLLCAYAEENGIHHQKWLRPFTRPGFEEA